MAQEKNSVPRGNLAGFVEHLGKDSLSGFLVFLIALPLCLAISIASGVPPIAGVFTAVVGAIVTTLLSNSELTIKGPAAGLIVIVMGCVTEFGEITGDSTIGGPAYRMMLAVGITAGIIQIGFGLFRLGILGEFFPSSVVHGMLAAIGIIIISKQVHTALGVMQVTDAEGHKISEPLELLARVPRSIMEMNPEIACIGLVSLIILFGLPLIRNKYVKRIPAQLIVVLLAIPMGMFFDLSHEHTYSMLGQEYQLGEKFLVNVPDSLFKAITFPDFGALQYPAAWKWVVMFALIGSLESLLSAKAIDLLDPWKRKTNLNRDMFAVGVANTIASGIGGIPMISEIVRSKANIDNGARTRFADLWHGLFMLAFVVMLPGLIHRIPLAALAAMLVYTGFRLASPREFVHVYHIGREQLIIFVVTVIGVLATDLLVGVFMGVGVKFLIHFMNGVPMKSFFKPFLEVEEQGEDTCIIRAKESAVFSNWIPFKRQIEDVGLTHRRNIIIDLSGTTLVDHSVMEKLHELQEDFQQEGLTLEIIGLESHQQLSHHENASRRRGVETKPTEV
jgi:MFS superfamily sulfate permease-like transporter